MLDDAYCKGPEMKTALSLTLGHPISFEYLVETLSPFEGWALFDFTRHCWYHQSRIASRLKARERMSHHNK